MADILFRYLLMARERDTAWYRRPFLSDDSITAAGVEQLVETAAARVVVSAQFMRISREARVLPASKQARIQFFDVPEPKLPQPPHCETRTERFALQHTMRIARCLECEGTGKISCPACRGRGERFCGVCHGRGRSLAQNIREHCPECAGMGILSCDDCNRRGRIVHLKCGGEGDLVHWQDAVYRYFVTTEEREILPAEEAPAALASRVREWLATHVEVVGGVDEETVADHLGYSTPAAMQVAHEARATADELHQSLTAESAERLFTIDAISLVPVARCVLRSSLQVVSYWLIGRGERALEIRPRPLLEPIKLAGWGGLAVAGATALAGANPGGPLAAGLIAAGLSAAVAGVSQVLRRAPRVKTIAVLPTFGRSTSYLLCLAAIGSYLKALRILDRTYVGQLKALLGQAPAQRHSNTVTLVLPDGTAARLVEVVNVERLTDDQLRLMVRSVDGLLYLEQFGAPSKPLRKLVRPALEERIGQARLMLALHENPQDLAGEGPVPIELVRRAFVKDVEYPVDWPAMFNRLIAPLTELLGDAFPPPLPQVAR